MSEDKQQTSATRRWKFPWAAFVAGLVFIVGVGIFMYPHVASWFSQLAQSKVIDSELVKVEENTQREKDIHDAIAAAHKYNEALASGAIYEANSNIASGRGELEPGALNYNELLNETGTGFMGVFSTKTLLLTFRYTTAHPRTYF